MKLFAELIAHNLDAGGSSGGAAAAADGGQGGSGAAAIVPASEFSAELARRAAEAAKDGGDGAAKGADEKPAGAADIYRPQGIDDKLIGKTDRETIDNLLKSIGEQPKAPAAAKDYVFEPPKEFAAKFGDLKDDPVMAMWRDVAHELGIPQKQFAEAVPKLYAKLEKAGLIEPGIDFDAEVKALAPDETDPKRALQKAALRTNNILTFVQDLERRGVTTKADSTVLASMGSSPAAVLAFEKLLALIPREHGPQGGGSGGAVHDQNDPETKALQMFPSHARGK